MGPPPTQTQTGYYEPQMAYGMMPGIHPPPDFIQIPPSYQPLQHQSNGGKRNNNEKIAEDRDVAPTITKVEEEAVATEEISAMPKTPKRNTPMP